MNLSLRAVLRVAQISVPLRLDPEIVVRGGLLQIVVRARRAMVTRLVVLVAINVEVLRARHLQLVSVNELVMGLVMMLMVNDQGRRTAADGRRLMGVVSVQVRNRTRAVLLRVDDHAGVSSWRLLQMMMVVVVAVFDGRIVGGVVMARVCLIRSLVVLNVSSGARRRVVAVVVVEAAIRVHDHTSHLVEVGGGGVWDLVSVMGMVAGWQRVQTQGAGQMSVHGVRAASGAGRGRVRSLLL